MRIFRSGRDGRRERENNSSGLEPKTAEENKKEIITLLSAALKKFPRIGEGGFDIIIAENKGDLYKVGGQITKEPIAFKPAAIQLLTTLISKALDPDISELKVTEGGENEEVHYFSMIVNRPTKR